MDRKYGLRCERRYYNSRIPPRLSKAPTAADLNYSHGTGGSDYIHFTMDLTAAPADLGDP